MTIRTKWEGRSNIIVVQTNWMKQLTKYNCTLMGKIKVVKMKEKIIWQIEQNMMAIGTKSNNCKSK